MADGRADRARGHQAPLKPTFVAVGDVMVDIAVDEDALARAAHAPGAVRVTPGGSAANAAVWAAARGAQATVVGRVGSDHGATMIRTALEDRGIHARLAVDLELPTGSVVVVGEGETRRVVADRGANANLAPADVPSPLAADVVLVSGYVLLQADSGPAAEAALERARATWLAVDAASARLVGAVGRDRFFAVTERADALFVNEDEAYALTGAPPEQAAGELAARYRLVCVKRGAAGAVAVLGDDVRSAVPPRVQPASSLGAGDAFAAALLTDLAGGAALDEALARGCEAGAQAAALPHPWPPVSN